MFKDFNQNSEEGGLATRDVFGFACDENNSNQKGWHRCNRLDYYIWNIYDYHVVNMMNQCH